MSQDFFDDARIVDKAEDAKAAAAFRTSQRIDKIHFANEARPGASAKTAEVVVPRGFGARSRHRSEGSHVLQPALAAGFVAIVSIIASWSPFSGMKAVKAARASKGENRSGAGGFKQEH